MPTPSSLAARHGALAVPRPDLAAFVVTGPERADWLQGLLTCEVKALGPGQGAWGLALSKTGKIQTDTSLVAARDALYLSAPLARAGALEALLRAHLVMEDAEVVDRSAELGWLMLHGPKAASVASRVASQARAAAPIDWTGLGGAAIVVARDELVAAVQALRGDPVVVASEIDWEALRVERLVPVYGVDVDERHNPHEASLERRTISWEKGCYLGQEAVYMQDVRGKVKHRLALVALDAGAEEVPPRGAAVADEASGEIIGEVTSAVSSQTLGRPLAIARLRARDANPGTRLSVAGRLAEVVDRV